METANRLSQVQEYYFSTKLREIRELEAAGKTILNLGIGSPDLPPPISVLEEISRNSLKPEMHQYQSYQGLPEFRQAIADFYDQRYGAELNPKDEILPLMGSKEGITHISLTYLNKGDKVLIPELGYPTYTSVTKMVEAEPVYYPLDERQNWEPDWSFFENLDFTGVKLIWINYPHMPTGQSGSLTILEKFVALAKKHGVLLVNDNPYSFISNKNPLSIFNVQGAKEVALELNSLSKTFNMAGWRVGWVCGGAENIQNVLRIKSNMDSGMFKPVQLAAIKALQEPNEWYWAMSDTYSERRTTVNKLVKALGCSLAEDQTGLFVWARIPEGKDLTVFVDTLLHEKGIFITPGHIFGAKGNQSIRISLCSPVAVFEQAIHLIES